MTTTMKETSKDGAEGVMTNTQTASVKVKKVIKVTLQTEDPH